MDFIILQTLSFIVAALIVLSYDIACQYSKKFWKRMEAFPSKMQLDLATVAIEMVIPKDHIAVHDPHHSQFLLNFLDYKVQTCGEGIESSWHVFNAISMATREMGPAMRHKVLNDHWGSWNWEKIQNFGMFVVLIWSVLSSYSQSGFLMSKTFVGAHTSTLKHTTCAAQFNKTFSAQTLAK